MKIQLGTLIIFISLTYVLARYHAALNTASFETEGRKRRQTDFRPYDRPPLGYCELYCGEMYDCMLRTQGECEARCSMAVQNDDLNTVRNNCEQLFDGEGCWEIQDTQWTSCAKELGFHFCRRDLGYDYDPIGMYHRQEKFHHYDKQNHLPAPPATYNSKEEGPYVESYKDCMSICISNRTRECFRGCPEPNPGTALMLKSNCDSGLVDEEFDECLRSYEDGYSQPEKWIQPLYEQYQDLYDMRGSLCEFLGCTEWGSSTPQTTDYWNQWWQYVTPQIVYP